MYLYPYIQIVYKEGDKPTSLEKEMAIHSSTLARKIPWMEELDRFHGVTKSQTRLSDFTFTSLDIYHMSSIIHRLHVYHLVLRAMLRWFPFQERMQRQASLQSGLQCRRWSTV